MKNNFRLIRAITQNAWHIHQGSGMGLMPIVTRFLMGEIPAQEDLDLKEGLSPNASRTISQYNEFKAATPYVSERDTWYYDDFPVLIENVLMIPVIGAIAQYDYCGTAGTKTIASWYQKAESDPNVKAVIEVKNTPGGEVFGTRVLADIKAKFSKPIVGLTEGMECSAGAYIGASDNYKLAASEECIIGSVGVMTGFQDWSKWYEKNGIVIKDLYSKASPLKNDAYRKALEGDYTGYTDGVLFKLDQSFMSFMQDNRPSISEQALQGADYTASGAIENGLIDAIGSFQDAYNKALELADMNISNSQKPNQTNTMSKTVTMEVPEAIAGAMKVFGAKVVDTPTADTNATNTDTPTADASATGDLTAQIEQLTAAASAKDIKISEAQATIDSLTAAKATAEASLAEANQTINTLKADNPASQRSEARQAVADASAASNTNEIQLTPTSDYLVIN